MTTEITDGTPRRLGFIGLGVMGFPMAGHLAQAGFELRVFNRTTAKARRWVDSFGGQLAASPADLAANSDAVVLCVGDDQDVRALCVGEVGLFAHLPAGALVIDHSTTSAAVAQEMAHHAAQREQAFVDAPVSGGQAGAENGQLSIMLGGTPAAFERARPVVQTYAKAVRHMGPVGAGQLTKMVNQVCVAGVLQGLAEGLAFARSAGLDLDAVLAAISQGAAQSWQMENRGQTMARGEFDFGFAVDLMRKDLGIALRAASEAGATLPVTALLDQFYAEVQQQGGGRWDTSSLITRLPGGRVD